jgi:Tfp pilus assembly protein PilE
MKRSIKSMLGVTLLEIMLVLAVAAMIIVMSVRYYESSSASEQANSALEMAQAISSIADGLAQPSGTYMAASQTAVQQMMPNQQMNTVWGATVTINPTDATHYTVTFLTMPSAVCAAFMPKLLANTKFTTSSTCNGGAFTYTFTSS